MQGQPERKRSRDTRMVERAIVLQVLRDDHGERWSRGELAGEISDFQPAVLAEALARLEREGVVHREGEQVWASRASRRLDELELISI
jgi:DNA-binding HxlR family transcriptional regulator